MADYSALKKPRSSATANRRNEKPAKLLTEKSQIIIEKNTDSEHTTINRGNEPYQCTGRFLDDFQNICKQNNLPFIPPIIQRHNKRPITPVASKENTIIHLEKGRSKQVIKQQHQQQSFLDSQTDMQMNQFVGNQQQQHMRQQQSITSLTEEDSKDDSNENLPRTFFLVKDRHEFFRPKIQVEFDNHDKQHSEIVSDVYIRGWKIEMPIMNVFRETMPCAEKILSINLWNCGLTDETLDALASFLPKCLNLKNINLDGNPVSDENFHKIINANSIIQNLSLRNCNITDVGAKKIGNALGSVHEQNSKLLTLNLSANQIGDLGACEIAKGLRTNRTLLVLNLACNQIGDEGAIKLAETISRFKMTQEEIVKRRMIKRDRILKELTLLPRKTKDDGQTGRSPNQKKSKQQDGTQLSPNKTLSKTRPQSGRDSSHESKSNTIKTKTAGGNNSTISNTLKKSSEKKEKEKENTASNLNMSEKTGGKASKPKSPKKSKDASDSSVDDLTRVGSAKYGSSNLFSSNPNEPLMDETEGIDGELWLTGNRTLICLNISRNKITSLGLRKFLLAIQYQLTINAFNKSYQANGLLKLNLSKNDFESDNDDLLRLNELLKSRDPLVHKVSDHALDTISSASREGKETNRSKSSKFYFDRIVKRVFIFNEKS